MATTPSEAASVEAGFLEVGRDLLAVFTTAGRCVRVSASSLRITGYDVAELQGADVREFVHPKDAALLERALQRLLEEGFADEVPMRFRRPDGGHTMLRWSAALQRESGLVFVIAREMRRERERTSRREAHTALRELAAERERVQSDLHDGLLQSLTGISLKLQTAQRMLPAQAEAAVHELESAAALLRDEQLELRFLVQEMKEGWTERLAPVRLTLEERLAEFGRRLHAIWGIQLATNLSGVGTMPPRLVPALFRIAQEAVVNAGKHGHARQAEVHVTLLPDRVRLAVTDDGAGFSFQGRYDDRQLREEKKGPAVLKQRVWSLGGTVLIDAKPGGTRIEVEVPLEVDD